MDEQDEALGQDEKSNHPSAAFTSSNSHERFEPVQPIISPSWSRKAPGTGLRIAIKDGLGDL